MINNTPMEPTTENNAIQYPTPTGNQGRRAGSRLSEYAKANVLTLLKQGDCNITEIAKKCGVDRSTVQRYSKGVGLKPQSTAEKLVRELNLRGLRLSRAASRALFSKNRLKQLHKLPIKTLADIIIRSDGVLSKRAEAELERTPDTPKYVPRPLMVILGDLVQGSKQTLSTGELRPISEVLSKREVKQVGP